MSRTWRYQRVRLLFTLFVGEVQVIQWYLQLEMAKTVPLGIHKQKNAYILSGIGLENGDFPKILAIDNHHQPCIVQIEPYPAICISANHNLPLVWRSLRSAVAPATPAFQLIPSRVFRAPDAFYRLPIHLLRLGLWRASPSLHHANPSPTMANLDGIPGNLLRGPS